MYLYIHMYPTMLQQIQSSIGWHIIRSADSRWPIDQSATGRYQLPEALLPTHCHDMCACPDKASRQSAAINGLSDSEIALISTGSNKKTKKNTIVNHILFVVILRCRINWLRDYPYLYGILIRAMALKLGTLLHTYYALAIKLWLKLEVWYVILGAKPDYHYQNLFTLRLGAGLN